MSASEVSHLFINVYNYNFPVYRLKGVIWSRRTRRRLTARERPPRKPAPGCRIPQTVSRLRRSSAGTQGWAIEIQWITKSSTPSLQDRDITKRQVERLLAKTTGEYCRHSFKRWCCQFETKSTNSISGHTGAPNPPLLLSFYCSCLPI